jgi:hypothetical protein
MFLGWISEHFVCQRDYCLSLHDILLEGPLLKRQASNDRGHIHLIFSPFGKFNFEILRSHFIVNPKESISGGVKGRF